MNSIGDLLSLGDLPMPLAGPASRGGYFDEAQASAFVLASFSHALAHHVQTTSRSTVTQGGPEFLVDSPQRSAYSAYIEVCCLGRRCDCEKLSVRDKDAPA
jgi:hypothetical protein